MDPYANVTSPSPTDLFIRRRSRSQQRIESARKTRRVAWEKRMRAAGYEIDALGAVDKQGNLIQTFAESEKGTPMRNQIKIIPAKEKVANIVEEKGGENNLASEVIDTESPSSKRSNYRSGVAPLPLQNREDRKPGLYEWTTDQAIGERAKYIEGSDLPNRGLLKSDVFTLGEDGKPLGVMTRAQRRKWDAANQDLMKKRKKELLIADRNYGSGGIGTGSG